MARGRRRGAVIIIIITRARAAFWGVVPCVCVCIFLLLLSDDEGPCTSLWNLFTWQILIFFFFYTAQKPICNILHFFLNVINNKKKNVKIIIKFFLNFNPKHVFFFFENNKIKKHTLRLIMTRVCVSSVALCKQNFIHFILSPPWHII